ncbi:hypothetical protein DPMN_091662 [Dreissena polymorpha]|uniref:Uncharacterized protein n=2 Tax=Dreissena polymorpha TaxID=45954 RepID=A0A9D4L2H5_DREPO|nr:hypothetical protein DPMN_091662 [Dreissena polymorpha]
MTHRQLRKRHFVSTVTDSDRPDFTPRRKSMGSYEKLSKHTQQGNQSREFHNLWSDIILMIIEDEFYHCSLTELSNALSYQDYPQAEILLQVMDVVLFKTDSELESNLALSVLDNVLTLHPPVTVAMQRLYLEALVDQESKKSNLPVSYEWAFIRDVISGSLLGDELFRRKNVGLLRFLTKLLKTNVDHFTPSSLNDQPPKHMLFKIFWPTSFVTFNSLCRELFDFVQEILEVLGTCHTASERICLRQVLQEVLLLVAMVTETCRRDEKVTGLKAMSAERTREFIIQLENRTRGRCNTDTFLFVSSRLLFPWLQVCFCKQVLDSHTLYNDYLVADRPEKKFDLSVIVTHYIYLLPNMIQDVGNAVQPKASTSQSSSIADKIPNKRQMAKNSKGESKLMRACIRNDIEKVRELLATPGVDVNATDHAGWTALHEAAFHGHVDCIRELLKYVPVKSAATGGHGTNALQKVDLLAVNDEGITPLHDAARKNKVEACRLLLQHGGTKLLRALNIWKQTPLQIAQSNQSYEVVSLLETYQGDETNRVSIRPEKSAEAIYKGTDPFETRYEEALCVDGRRIYADKCSTLLYIQVVTELIVAKICLTNELSRTNRTVNQCKQCQQRRESLSEISNGNKLTDVDKNKNHVMQDTVPPQTDQQRCETSYVSDVRNLSSEDSILLENGTSTSGSQMQETCDMDHFDVTHLDMYVERFRRHLLRISQPEDTRLIEESLFELKMFSESLR